MSKQQTIEALKEQIEMLVKDDEKQQKIIIEQAKRIDKAIEYIQNHQPVFQLNTKKQLEEIYYEFYQNILEILGDKENEK